jgi:CO/xanthine dehydrogenase Mo-binding subunit
VQVHRLVMVQDVGLAINPLVVEGQMMGGGMQGLGWALYEGLMYDRQGQPLNGSWLEYTVPHMTHSASQIDTVIVEVPTDHGPMGARGVGEPPVIATAAAVANAIADATGARLTDLPIIPARLVQALDGPDKN